MFKEKSSSYYSYVDERVTVLYTVLGQQYVACIDRSDPQETLSDAVCDVPLSNLQTYGQGKGLRHDMI